MWGLLGGVQGPQYSGGGSGGGGVVCRWEEAEGGIPKWSL